MDGSEPDYQPRKRARLEYAFESTLMPERISQIDNGDDEDWDHGVYTHALPRLNLEGVRI